MTAESALLEAYAEWRRLAGAANQAIGSRNWPFVLECHRVIEQLQPRIAQLTCQASGEWRHPGKACPTGNEKIRIAVLELIKLVESNNSLLNSVRKRVSSNYQQQQQAGRNLKRLQNSYAAVHRPAWFSFS
jgi:hypothetical protein